MFHATACLKKFIQHNFNDHKSILFDTTKNPIVNIVNFNPKSYYGFHKKIA
jgi:hypothetical protein